MPKFKLGVIRQQIIEETGYAEIEAGSIQEAARKLALALDESNGSGGEIAPELGKEELIQCQRRFISWTESGEAFDVALV